MVGAVGPGTVVCGGTGASLSAAVTAVWSWTSAAGGGWLSAAVSLGSRSPYGWPAAAGTGVEVSAFCPDGPC